MATIGLLMSQKTIAEFEPFAWWCARKEIGRGLREILGRPTICRRNCFCLSESWTNRTTIHSQAGSPPKPRDFFVHGAATATALGRPRMS